MTWKSKVDDTFRLLEKHIMALQLRNMGENRSSSGGGMDSTVSSTEEALFSLGMSITEDGEEYSVSQQASKVAKVATSVLDNTIVMRDQLGMIDKIEERIKVGHVE